MTLMEINAAPNPTADRYLGRGADEATLRASARQFALAEILPRSREFEVAKKLPREMFKALGEQGFLGVLIPDEYGGTGLGMLELTWIVEEFGRVDGGAALSIAASNSLSSGQILHFGSEELKKKYLPKLASGTFVGAWGLTEPGSGSDAGALKTKAVKVDGGWKINGRKSLITHASFCDVAVVLAVTDAAKKTKGITAFAVERGMAGFSSGKTEDKLGCCASDTGDLVFQDCFVPDSQMIGTVNNGFVNALQILEEGRVGIGSLSVGMAQGALDAAVKYVNERETFGKLLKEHQAIQFKLADMQTQIHAARLMIAHAAALKDTGTRVTFQGSMAKLYASEMAMKVTEEAIQIHGGYGYTKDFMVEKFWRDAKLCTIGEGSSEVQRMVIARWLLDHHQ